MKGVMYHFVSCILFLPHTCLSSVRRIGKVKPGFQGSQMQFIDNNGLFLVSNTSSFGFGFNANSDITSFTLVIIHMSSSRIIWSANRDYPVGNSDSFVFDDDGNANLQSNGKVVWSTNTAKNGVSAMELLDSGNLVFVKDDGAVVWQSFSHPTNTLMPNQDFIEGMKLVSNSKNNLSFSLQIKTEDLILSAEFKNPQPYWSMSKDKRRIINKSGGDTNSATIEANSWRFYDENKVFLWQFVFADDPDANATWIAVLEDDGFIKFYNVLSRITASLQIPDDSCSRPQACSSYFVCHDGNICQCPLGLAQVNCKPQIASSCSNSKDSSSLVNAGENLSYFALGFVSPSSKTDINGCKSSCLNNCTCLAMFFDNKSGNCYLFDQIGSFEDAKNGPKVESYVKVSGTQSDTGQGQKNKKHSTRVVILVIVIVIAGTFIIIGLVLLGIRYYKNNGSIGVPDEISEEDTFLENISGMPIRFSYKDLQEATNNFTTKLGQGGFGSVYQGILKDGSRIAVKQLEGIGQGKKEFRAEVSIIGSIHHHHLVKLKGFCAQGKHRLLVYEYMANGSLDRWIFGKFLMDWDTRYSIAIGTAKGLAYLHEDCDVKIIHCDIKPENVLLDDNFLAKVSDFGLAKLMTREESHVFTTLRGTRGYLAPEWITNYAISEKSDVYSYGMVLLEIISGRKNYSSSEISQFPTYAFKMMEEGKGQIIVDEKMKVDENDERVAVATRVALWCIQDDMNLRPSMTKVVQMLEGLCPVPTPPVTAQTGSRFYLGLFKSVSEAGTSSGPSDGNVDSYISDARLSGPR
ncbi:G-type lectin S-receptor-like serine/threonine-protein kinase SD2-5 [Cynara cardunculus var. scolymus]|uniref:G-type lectin S-receptor-like serine/threonine-protein kinase SD2-5 n=1 Tax=Cynara cardunculus var. scolymus TaxID=59895 RepID=UPI000D62A036|nr:G-type lectin S-receptor-like serine/threonine-protein kinase SD2-5 [Cynara cardunculus var. scolymus]